MSTSRADDPADRVMEKLDTGLPPVPAEDIKSAEEWARARRWGLDTDTDSAKRIRGYALRDELIFNVQVAVRPPQAGGANYDGWLIGTDGGFEVSRAARPDEAVILHVADMMDAFHEANLALYDGEPQRSIQGKPLRRCVRRDGVWQDLGVVALRKMLVFTDFERSRITTTFTSLPYSGPVASSDTANSFDVHYQFEAPGLDRNGLKYLKILLEWTCGL